MKYYFCSDIHGIEPSILKRSLIDNGFIFDDENHVLVVCGDITEQSFENELIDYLIKLENAKQLIAVVGNHDRDAFFASGLKNRISNVNFNWISNLPYQFENEHFRIAHGMFIKKDMMKHQNEEEFKWLDKTIEKISIWLSPILLGLPLYNIVGVEHHNLIQMKSFSFEEYAFRMSDKDLYLGHMHKTSVERYLDMNNVTDYKINQDGLVSYERIQWVAGNVFKERDKVYIFVKEY